MRLHIKDSKRNVDDIRKVEEILANLEAPVDVVDTIEDMLVSAMDVRQRWSSVEGDNSKSRYEYYILHGMATMALRRIKERCRDVYGEYDKLIIVDLVNDLPDFIHAKPNSQ